MDSLSSSDEEEADLSGDDQAAFGEVSSKKNLESKFGAADRSSAEIVAKGRSDRQDLQEQIEQAGRIKEPGNLE